MKINIAKLLTIMSHIIVAAPAIVGAIRPVIAEIRKPAIS